MAEPPPPKSSMTASHTYVNILTACEHDQSCKVCSNVLCRATPCEQDVVDPYIYRKLYILMLPASRRHPVRLLSSTGTKRMPGWGQCMAGEVQETAAILHGSGAVSAVIPLRLPSAVLAASGSTHGFGIVSRDIWQAGPV